MDQRLNDPDFVTSGGGWVAAGPLPAQWLRASAWPVEPSRLRLGLELGWRPIAGSLQGPMATMTATATLAVYEVQGQGYFFQRCAETGCDMPEALGAGRAWHWASGRMAPSLSCSARACSPSASGSARRPGCGRSPQAFPVSDGNAYRRTVDASGGWHMVWVIPPTCLQLSHRNVDGSWTAATPLGTDAYGAQARFDGSNRLHIFRCELSGVVATTWTQSEGLSSSVSLSNGTCNGGGLMRSSVDAAGRVVVAWASGNIVFVRRRSLAGVWSESRESHHGNDLGLAGLVMDQAGSPAAILADYQTGYANPLHLALLADGGDWTTNTLAVRDPFPTARYEYVGLNSASGRLLVLRYEQQCGLLRRRHRRIDDRYGAGLGRDHATADTAARNASADAGARLSPRRPDRVSGRQG